MLRTVHLHGRFADFHEGPIQVEADTAAEAVEAITRQLPGFKPSPIEGYKRLRVAHFDTYEELFAPLGDQSEIHLVPQFAGGGGAFALLLGGVLTGGGGGFFASGIGGMILKVGALMLLGALSSLLAPSPDSDREQEKSRYLGPPKNTVKIGTRIPIVYGKHRAYGHFLGFDVNASPGAVASEN